MQCYVDIEHINILISTRKKRKFKLIILKRRLTFENEL